MSTYIAAGIPFSDELYHYRTKGSVNGVRRYQNEDGSLTPEGRRHYGVGDPMGATSSQTGEQYRGGRSPSTALGSRYKAIQTQAAGARTQARLIGAGPYVEKVDKLTVRKTEENPYEDQYADISDVPTIAKDVVENTMSYRKVEKTEEAVKSSVDSGKSVVESVLNQTETTTEKKKKKKKKKEKGGKKKTVQKLHEQSKSAGKMVDVKGGSSQLPKYLQQLKNLIK